MQDFRSALAAHALKALTSSLQRSNVLSCREEVRQEPGGLLTGFEAGMCPHLRVPGTRTGIVPTPMRGLSPCCSSQIVVGALTRPARSPPVMRDAASGDGSVLNGANTGVLSGPHGRVPFPVLPTVRAFAAALVCTHLHSPSRLVGCSRS